MKFEIKIQMFAENFLSVVRDAVSNRSSLFSHKNGKKFRSSLLHDNKLLLSLWVYLRRDFNMKNETTHELAR